MINKTFLECLEEMRQIHEAKNDDYTYGDDPYWNYRFSSLLVRHFSDPVDMAFVLHIGNKLARIAALKQKIALGKTPNYESLLDSYKDLATHASIWYAHEKDRLDNKVCGNCVKPRKECKCYGSS